eukprot:7381583-Prymnesium_polylepis.2
MEWLAEVLLMNQQLTLPTAALVAREATTARAKSWLKVVSPGTHRVCTCANKGASSCCRGFLCAALRHSAAAVQHAQLDGVELLVKSHHRPALRRQPRRLRRRDGRRWCLGCLDAAALRAASLSRAVLSG